MKTVMRFTAAWCGPCKALAPVLESVKTEIPIQVVDIDTPEGGTLSQTFGIRGVPTLVMVEDGKAIKTLVGMQTKDKLEAWLND